MEGLGWRGRFHALVQALQEAIQELRAHAFMGQAQKWVGALLMCSSTPDAPTSLHQLSPHFKQTSDQLPTHRIHAPGRLGQLKVQQGHSLQGVIVHLIIPAHVQPHGRAPQQGKGRQQGTSAKHHQQHKLGGPAAGLSSQVCLQGVKGMCMDCASKQTALHASMLCA